MIKSKQIKIFFITIILVLLFVNSCVSNKPNQDIQSTAMAFVQTSIVQTQTAQPTITLNFTATATMVIPTTSPLSTQPPIFIITPNAVQVERWREYQTELAKLVLSHQGAEYPFYESALCEWDILGQSDQKIYVWAECAGNSWGRGPAVVYLEADGSIKNVDYAFPGYGRDDVIQKLFPVDVQSKIYLYFSSFRSQEMVEHIEYRYLHPEEPPLIVLLNPLITP